MKKVTGILYDKTSVGFLCWSCFGILITVLFYKSFEQPLIFDRAYLVYMSQVVFRGDSLYNATTFGYTPLSTVVVGLFMKVGQIFSWDTIESARIAGLLLYGSICGAFFLLSKSIFRDQQATYISMLFFCGLGYIQMLSGINAEPKLWVLLFSILGLKAFNQGNWFYIGLYFSLASMSWHVAVVSLFVCAIMLPWKSSTLGPTLGKLFLGVLIGVLPVVFYLQITDGYMAFWNQAVVRKLVVEGAIVGEAPFLWLKKGVYPYFVLEILHFLFAAAGCISVIYSLFKDKWGNEFLNKRAAVFLIVYCLFWSGFNTLDFQTCVDLLPLIPPVVLFSAYFLSSLLKKVQGNFTHFGLVVLICFYNFFDALLYDLPFTYADQVEQVSDIRSKYGKAFVMGFEEYYTVLEKPMPSKFMRFASYEDHMIDNEGGCEKIQQLMLDEKFDVIVLIDRGSRTRSRKSDWLMSKLHQPKPNRNYTHGVCAQSLVEHLTSTVETESFKVNVQAIPWSNDFYISEYYSIFKIRDKH